MTNPKYKLYRQIFTKLNRLLTLDSTRLDTNFTSTLSLSNLSFYFYLSKKNNYFFLLNLSITSKTSTIRTHTEFEIRVWANGLAEVISYKNKYKNDFENIYDIKNGVEIPRQELQMIANNSLNSFLADALSQSKKS